MIDFFEHINKLPICVAKIVNYYGDTSESFLTSEQMDEFQEAMEVYGYKFDYGLDMVPYGLQKIEMESVEPLLHKSDSHYYFYVSKLRSYVRLHAIEKQF